MRKITYPSLTKMISDLKEEGAKSVRVSAKRTFNNKGTIPSVELQVIVTTFVGSEVGELLIHAGRTLLSSENKITQVSPEESRHNPGRETHQWMYCYNCKVL